MPLPPITARVKKGHAYTASRVNRFYRGVLVTVTTLTGKRQVVEIVTTLLGYRDDVLNRERVRGKAQLTQAVLAAAARTLGNYLLLGRREGCP